MTRNRSVSIIQYHCEHEFVAITDYVGHGIKDVYRRLDNKSREADVFKTYKCLKCSKKFTTYFSIKNDSFLL